MSRCGDSWEVLTTDSGNMLAMTNDSNLKPHTYSNNAFYPLNDSQSVSNMANQKKKADVVDLLSSDDENDYSKKMPPTTSLDKTFASATKNTVAVAPLSIRNPYAKVATTLATTTRENKSNTQTKKKSHKTTTAANTNMHHKKRPLQAGLVLEEDIHDSLQDHTTTTTTTTTTASDSENPTMELYISEQESRISKGQRPELFHDLEFEAVPSSIDGAHKANQTENPKCHCSGGKRSKLCYKQRGPNKDQPYFACGKCPYFKWAFSTEQMQWFRFGLHTSHTLVDDTGFSADDLLQGKVGDCWFLSALAVIAERPDLMLRLFQGSDLNLNEHGILQVNLFQDGFWKKVTMDNFLPCLIDQKGEKDLERAIQASLGIDDGSRNSSSNSHQQCLFGGTGRTLNGTATSAKSNNSSMNAATSSKYDPFALSDKNREVIKNTNEFLERDRFLQRNNRTSSKVSLAPKRLSRIVLSTDLAYSKAKKNQLWVPFLEKAYAKIHGSYQAISGGHIAEAFLDLTGAPTLQYRLHCQGFDPRTFWYKLVSWHKQKLPMGCGTDSSAAGIIGMHAYSILDVREVRNVAVDFFRDKLLTGSLGNVSGFTKFDGTVRILQIRNPHGRGEWKGDFSDRSGLWEKLLASTSQHEPGLHRSMKNDGQFWIDYDNFLMGFSNVDVVLAFLGNHAKSFPSNFPAKKSNLRCERAFEVSLLDPQPGVPSRDTVDLYVMGIQKTRRGASHGRSDRKKSYKLCDFGILVGENLTPIHSENDDLMIDTEIDTVRGKMFGLTRNGHYRLILDRKKSKRLLIMPISFGHPAATDKELPFVLRFVSDAPLFVRELPHVPRLDRVMQRFSLQSSRWTQHTNQGQRRVLLEDKSNLYRIVQINCLGDGGGTVFLYLYVNEQELKKREESNKNYGSLHFSFSIESNCRGMICRTEEGLLEHETIAKGKKFQAAWRRYNCQFVEEKQSRLLMVLVQSGEDTEMGSIICKTLTTRLPKIDSTKQSSLAKFLKAPPTPKGDKYDIKGIFCGTSCSAADFASSGSSSDQASSHIERFFKDSYDAEVEQALAISQGDLELQETLERSRGEDNQKDHFPATMEALDLQRALELSRADSKNNYETGGGMQGTLLDLTGSHDNIIEDEDIKKAIQLSLAEKGTSHESTIDLTESEGVVQDNGKLLSADSKKRKPEMTEYSRVEVAQNATYDRNQKRKLALEAATKRMENGE